MKLLIGIGLFVIISIILVTSSPFQSTSFYEHNRFLNLDFVKIVYAEEDGGDDKKDDKDDDKKDDKDDDKKDDKDDDKKDDKDDDKKDDKDDDNGGDDKDDNTNNGLDNNRDESKETDDSSNKEVNQNKQDSSNLETISETTDVSTASESTDINEVLSETITTADQPITDVAKIESATPTDQPITDVTPSETITTADQPITDVAKIEAATTADQPITDVAKIEAATTAESVTIPRVDDSTVQKVVDRINNYVIEEGKLSNEESTGIKNTIDNELKNNPNGEVGKALETIAGIESSYGPENSFIVEFEDEITKKLAEMILEKYPKKGKFGAGILASIITGVTNNLFKNAIGYEINSYDEKGDRGYIGLTLYVDDKDKKHKKHHDHHHHTKKIIKYSNNKCATQTGSILLDGKIGPRAPVLLGDFGPCNLKDGKATLNLPDNGNIKFVALYIDKKGSDHEGIILEMEKIQNLANNNALYVVEFDDKMKGIHPITSKELTLDDINAIALFNESKETVNLGSGNSLAMSAVLKS
ncbi:MAG: hypothetical protein ACE5SW_09020 [Nitrososphaeraceae archaeon]